MLKPNGLSYFGFTYDNWGADPSATPGTSVTPGASNAEGSWTQVATGSNIAQDCYWLEIHCSGGSNASQAKQQLLDIGVDPAGGSSYTAVISNLIMGMTGFLSAGAHQGPRSFLFPYFIKAGSSVAVRIQGSHATAGSVRVAVKFHGQPSNPEAVPVGQYSETIGPIVSSGGFPVFTPGTAADGTWLSLGTTARDLWWWQLGVQITNTVITNTLFAYVDLAFGDGSNKHIIQRDMFTLGSSETIASAMRTNLTWLSCYRPVPAGATIYVRGRSNAAPNSGWNAVAVGVGG